jgi:hypothetical protein
VRKKMDERMWEVVLAVIVTGIIMETILKVEYAVDDEDFKCVLEQINLFFV